MADFIKEAVDTLLDAITGRTKRRDIANACGGSLSILNKTKGRLRMIATAYQLDFTVPPYIMTLSKEGPAGEALWKVTSDWWDRCFVYVGLKALRNANYVTDRDRTVIEAYTGEVDAPLRWLASLGADKERSGRHHSERGVFDGLRRRGRQSGACPADFDDTTHGTLDDGGY